ncbi:hypothetical protein LJC53_07485 [Bacteroidales bacterium OttesenSCG-928-C03]|nr:hypothetical protein [Bacteroidales bacterium OttesenSCG-928-C03]
MKKSRKIPPALLLLLTVFLTLQSFAQEDKSADNLREVKKYAYQIIGELDLLNMGASFYLKDPYHRYNQTSFDISISLIGFNLINNMVYKDKVSVGLGAGIQLMFPEGEMRYPLFVDFRYYFTEKKITPFINVGAGTIFIVHYTRWELFGVGDAIFRYKPGLYLNCSGGFKYKHFQLNAGINLTAYEWMHYNPAYGNTLSLHFVIKAGFNF